jgi:hypothetical protein
MEALRTRGAAPKLVKRRIDRIAEIGKLAKTEVATQPSLVADQTLSPRITPPDPEPVPAGPTPEEAADVTALRGSLGALKQSQSFTDAATALAALELKSDQGKAMRDELVNACSRAGRYIATLSYALNTGGYEGTIRRRAGRSLEAKITSANPQIFVVDLGFGPNEVEVGEFAPDWLVEAGLATFPPASPASADAWETLMSYALLSGLDSLVKEQVEPLGGASPEFAKRWALLAPLR